MQFKTERITFEAAWKDGATKLVRLTTERLREKQNVKVIVGVAFAMFKSEGENDKTIQAHTIPESVYSEAAVSNFSRSEKRDLRKRMQ